MQVKIRTRSANEDSWVIGAPHCATMQTIPQVGEYIVLQGDEEGATWWRVERVCHVPDNSKPVHSGLEEPYVAVLYVTEHPSSHKPDPARR